MSLQKNRTDPSGPRGLPLIGHIPEFLRDRLGFLSRCAAEYGDVVRLNIGGRTFLLNNPDDIKHVLVTHSENYDKGPRLTSLLGKRLSGEGLLTSSGAVHLRQRRLMQPLFYRTAIKGFAKTIVNGVEKVVAHWENGAEINIGHEMMALAQHNIIKIVFGQDFEDGSCELSRAITIRKKYVEHVHFSLLPFPEYLPPGLYLTYRKAMKFIDETTHREIQRRLTVAMPDQDLLSLLMKAKYDDGTVLTEKQIRDELLTFFSAGYETIGEALTWTWYLISEHPHVESKCLAELREVLGGRPPTGEDVPKLRYTSMVLEEALRLFPPTWLFVRINTKEDSLPSGYTIPAGSKLYLCQYLMHRNTRFWPNPERFDPDRFTEPAKKERPAFAYFPFGGGVRFCIGEALAKMQCVLALATIASRYALRQSPGQTVVPKPQMTLRPQGKVMMRVEQRDLYGAVSSVLKE